MRCGGVGPRHFASQCVDNKKRAVSTLSDCTSKIYERLVFESKPLVHTKRDLMRQLSNA